ncbi:MAG: hypothetical protein AUK44_08440 [Porphyromonadaceae bacterium CG2_30_38_12]|nr:MAG: hypothetical protein AUK44_08440 [Porphyromonadaceae bacterium CG2_30_38_12]
MRRLKLFFLVSILLVSFFANAYDGVGHRIIADIAYRNLTAKAKKQCDKTLGKRGIIYAATWADEVRSDKKYEYSYPWHYQNLKDSMSISQLEYLFKYPTSEGEHLFYALQTLTHRLKANANDAEALKFLVHFVADLHQPMHLGRLVDLGANKIKVQWFGKNTNLHAVWDGLITESQRMSYSEYSNYLLDYFAPSKAIFKKETLLDAIYKTYLLRNEVYNFGVPDTNNYGYIYLFAKKNDDRLYSAGIQLAKLLNEIYK